MRAFYAISVILLLLGFSGLSHAAAPIAENLTITGWQDTDNLTLSWDSYDADADDVVNITNWEVNGDSYTLLNMPFEGGTNGTYAKDYSGNGYDVQSVSGTVLWEEDGGYDGFGAMNNSWYSNSYYNLGGDATLDQSGTSDVSFEMWLKPMYPGSNDYVGGFTALSWSRGYGFYYSSSSEVCFHINSYSSNKACAPISEEIWHHLVGTYNGSEIALYVNGSKYSNDSFTGTIGVAYPFNDFCLGSDCTDSSESYSIIDNVRVYSNALTAEQVSLLYSDDLKTIHSSETTDGQNWSGCVTPNDMSQDGAMNCTENVTIGVEHSVAFTNISSCQEISSSGDYILNSNLSGANITTGSGLSCIKISAPDVRLVCDNYSITNNGTGGTTYGIIVDNINNTIISNCSAISGYSKGLFVLGAHDTSIVSSRLFNNSRDFEINNTLSGTARLKISDLMFDNPSGAGGNDTTILLSHDLSAGDAYYINWSALPAAVPSAELQSFENKHIKITNMTSNITIDELIWTWTDAEVAGHNELALSVWEYSDSWSNTGILPDSYNNRLKLNNITISSVYSILENTTGAVIGSSLTIEGPGTYLLDGNLTGVNVSASPLGGSACIKINVSNVTLDCQGYSLYHSTDLNTYGILAIGKSDNPIQNVTIKNCDVHGYDNAIAFKNVEYSLVSDNNATDMGVGVLVAGDLVNTNEQNLITRNRVVRASGGTGFMSTAGRNNTYSENYVSTFYGFRNLAQFDKVLNNTITFSGTGYGILVGPSYEALIANNTIDNFAYGIYADCSACLCTYDIIDNDIQNMAVSGIEMLSASHNEVRGNTINNAGTNGILLHEDGAFNNQFDNNTINGTTYGIRLFNKTGDTTNWVRYNNISNASNTGILLDDGTEYVRRTVVQGNIVEDSGNGIKVDGADRTTLADNIVHATTGSGIWVSGAIDTTLSRDRMFDNANDLKVEMPPGVSEDLNMTNVIFDRPTGDYTDFTNLSMDDTVSASSSYAIEWTTTPSSPPSTVFKNANVNITPLSGTVTIESVRWEWSDSYVPPYNESTVELWKYNGSWSNTSAARDFVGNTLTLTSYTPNSTYTILAEKGPSVITSCQDITEGGDYVLGADLTGTAGLACLNITAGNVTIDCMGYSLSGSDTGYGFFLDGVSDVTLENCEVDSYERGLYLSGASGCSFTNMTSTDSDNPFYVEDSEDAKFTGCNIRRGGESGTTITHSRRVHIDPTYSCGSEIGYLVNQSNDTIIEGIACNNTQYGIYVLDSLNTTINHSKTYNNSMDLKVENNLVPDVNITIVNLTFDNPAGDLSNFTVIDMNDTVTGLTWYTMNWSPVTSHPGNMTSFSQKLINITAGTLGVKLNNISFRWDDSESAAINETQLELWKYNGTDWSNTHASRNTGANILNLEDHNPSSLYGIFLPSTFISVCTTILASNNYVWVTDTLQGAPITRDADHLGGKTCIQVNATNVTLDCQGYNISNNGTAGSTSAIYITPSSSDITIKNCPDLSDYTYGLYVLGADNVTLSNATAFNNSHGFYLLNSSGSNISGTASNSNTGYGYYLETSPSCSIEGSSTSGNLRGIYLDGSVNCDILSNPINTPSSHGIFIDGGSNGALIWGNNVLSSGGNAIYLSGSFESDVLNNTITGSNAGIRLESNSDQNQIVSNTIAGTTTTAIAILNQDSGDNDVFFNNISGAAQGIVVDEAALTHLQENNITQCSLAAIALDTAPTTSIIYDHLYNNTKDMVVAFTPTGPIPSMSYTLQNVIFDNPAGNYTAFTNLSIDDDMENNTRFHINWSDVPPGAPYTPFENKFLNLTPELGNVTIENITWHWTDFESSAYDESSFEFWLWDGLDWTYEIPTGLDTTKNTITGYWNIASTYGILDSGLKRCQYINTSGIHNLTANAYSAPFDVSNVAGVNTTCIKIESSDVVFDCNGFNITNVGVLDASGIVIYGDENTDYTNITIQNCPYIQNYEVGVAIHQSAQDVLDNVDVYNSTTPSGLSGYGVYIYNSSICNITNSAMFTSGDDGLRIEDGTAIRVEGNQLSLNGRHGMFSTSGSDLTVVDNAGSLNDGSGFLIRTNYSNISNNIAASNQVNGFSLESLFANASNNTATGNDINGFYIESGFSSIWNNTASTNTRDGFNLDLGSSNLWDNVAYGNDEDGMQLENSIAVEINDTHLYGNAIDFNVKNYTEFDVYNMTFDNPAGNFLNYTSMNIIDSSYSGDYHFDWSLGPGPLPSSYSSYLNKYVEITNMTPSSGITRVDWTWSAAEEAAEGGPEALYKWDGSWTNVSGTFYPAENRFEIINFYPESTYAFVYNHSLIETSIYGCELINSNPELIRLMPVSLQSRYSWNNMAPIRHRLDISVQ